MGYRCGEITWCNYVFFTCKKTHRFPGSISRYSGLYNVNQDQLQHQTPAQQGNYVLYNTKGGTQEIKLNVK